MRHSAGLILAILLSAGAAAGQGGSPNGPRQHVAGLNTVPYADAFPDLSGAFAPAGNGPQQITRAIADCNPGPCTVIITPDVSGSNADWVGTTPSNPQVVLQDWRGGDLSTGEVSGGTLQMVNSSGVVFGQDLAKLSSTTQKVIGFEGIPINAGIGGTPPFGSAYMYNMSGDSHFDLAFAVINPTVAGGSLLPATEIDVGGPTGQFTTVDQLTETLNPTTGLIVGIRDRNCLGTILNAGASGVADEFTIDPFSPTNGRQEITKLYLPPCTYPYETETPWTLNTGDELFMSIQGTAGATQTFDTLRAGPNFPAPVQGPGPTFALTATASGCASTYTGSTTIDYYETWYWNVGPQPDTTAGAAQTNFNIPAGQCANLTITSPPTNAGGVHLFATAHSNGHNYTFQAGGTVGAGTLQIPPPGNHVLITVGPTAPGYNQTGGLIYLSGGNSASSVSNFGVRIDGGFFDGNGMVDSCIVQLGAQELSGPFEVQAKNCSRPAASLAGDQISTNFMVEGYDGSVTTNNSKFVGFNFGDSTCSVAHPCGGYPAQGSITAAVNPTAACVILDQIQSYRGGDDGTCTPNTANGSVKTPYGVLVVGTVAAAAPPVPGDGGGFLFRLHNEGTNGMLAAVKVCGSAVSVNRVTASTGTAVDLDDLNSAACQTAAPQSFAVENITPASQPSYESVIDNALAYGSSASAIVDHTTGYSTVTGSFGSQDAHYVVYDSPLNYQSRKAIATPKVILAGSSTGSATLVCAATCGTPTLTVGSSSGTPAVTASLPIVLTAATGNLTCPTCGTGPGSSTANDLVKFSGTDGLTLAGAGIPAGNVVQTVYNTASATNLTGNINTVTMIASTGAQHGYRYSFVASISTIGSSCVGNTTVSPSLGFTDPNGSAQTHSFGALTIASSGNGTLGEATSGNFFFVSKTTTPVSFSVTYSAGGSCSPAPAYQWLPTLEQLW
jgi:hypothetical protein